MIILKPEDVKQRCGPHVTQKFLVMIDERAGIVEILERRL